MIISLPLPIRIHLLVASFVWMTFVAGHAIANPIGDELRPLLERYCWECHSGDQAEAGINLEALLIESPIVRHRKTWRRVSQLVELHSMPPQDAAQPSGSQRQKLVGDLRRVLNDFDYSKVNHAGLEPIRRLTHREYNNTLRDLLGVDLRPADRFPKELSGATGFDNAAATLSLQPALMERYIAAAERTVDAAIPLTDGKSIEKITQRQLFRSNDIEKLDDQQVRKALKRMLWRAYRRPPPKSDLKQLLQNYQQLRTTGHSQLAAFKQLLPSVLISPHFLLRIESPPQGNSATPIDDWELASRLSYFLWSSMPDDELFRLAAAGTLNDTDNLQRQLKRMLRDPKSEAFYESFAGQWLSTRLVGHEIRRDPIDEPWCTDTLMEAMRDETKLLFTTIVRDNRPMTELLDANYTFVNAELASTLYDMKGVRGESMRRVKLNARDRRGLLGHAAVLAVTSNHEETSPIKRGAYILETLLGNPPPPPPPEVAELNEELEENDRLTFAQKLQRHANDPRCAACHQTIDPLGIALEDYGSFGRYRADFEDDEIMTRTTLADGHEISGLQGLSEYLLTHRRDDFIRNLVTRTLEYAIGRPVEYYDEPAVRKIITYVNDNNLKMQSLLEGVITSYPFQYRQAAREEP